MTPTNILEQLQRDEGLRLFPYLDSVGIKTIGYGHNLQAHPNPVDGVQFGISIKQAIEILQEDIDRTTRELRAELPGTSSLDWVRFGVLQNMAFNMGVHGLLGFTNFLAYLQTYQYRQAASAMMASLWAKQVGLRAARLSDQVILGTWQ